VDGLLHPSELVVVGDKLFFTAEDPIHVDDRQIWVVTSAPPTTSGVGNVVERVT
jgi:hypothetical protein